jgi:hypothetical protein
MACDLSDLPADLVARVSAESAPEWWCLIGVEMAGGKPKARLQATGDLSIAEMEAQLLKDDQVQAGLVRVLGVDQRGPVTSTRSKLVAFVWVGASVPRVKRAQVLPIKSALMSFFQGERGRGDCPASTFGVADRRALPPCAPRRRHAASLQATTCLSTCSTAAA